MTHEYLMKGRKNTGRHAAGMARPHVWLCGPDEYRHQMYTPFLKAKAQANYRQEGWSMTFDDFFDLWNGKWERRGRKPDDLCLTRIDVEKPWTRDNVYIIERLEHLKMQNQKRIGKTYNKRKGPNHD